MLCQDLKTERERERERKREREREMFHNVSNVLLVLFCMMDQTGQQDQESMDADQLYNFLKEKTNDDIAECLKKNEITGKMLTSLTEDQIKEMLPAIGDRIQLIELLKKVQHQAYMEMQHQEQKQLYVQVNAMLCQDLKRERERNVSHFTHSIY